MVLRCILAWLNIKTCSINADAAMLTSKYRGRNTYSVCLVIPSISMKKRVQTKLINDLYKAVEEHQFVLFYQPKFNAKDREICGVEALHYAWKHPTLGMLTPNMFINGAEKTGLIYPNGLFGMEEHVNKFNCGKSWGMPLYPIAVNLSAGSV